MVYGKVYNTSVMTDFFVLLNQQVEGPYLNLTSLKYKKGIKLSLQPYEQAQYLSYLEDLANHGSRPFNRLSLKAFTSKCIYFTNCNELATYVFDCHKEIVNDLFENGNSLSERMKGSIYTSRLYSEIEGTLNVEGVPTTRKRLKDIIENNAMPENRNDIIVSNINRGMKFILERPTFNKENLFKLYSILSKDCLDGDDKLREGEYYRYDDVEVGGYKGCPVAQIEECMDSLFAFVNDNLNSSKISFFLPHICHYYLVLISWHVSWNRITICIN